MFRPLTAVVLIAAGLGAMHTMLGPDHYRPFAVLARAGKWSRALSASRFFLVWRTCWLRFFLLLWGFFWSGC